MTQQPSQLDVLRKMTPEQRYFAALGLLRAALKLKEASLRSWRPELSEKQIRQLLKEYVLYARS